MWPAIGVTAVLLAGDRVLKALVHKTGVIRQQLGSLAPVLEKRLEERLTSGIVRRDVQALTRIYDRILRSAFA